MMLRLTVLGLLALTIGCSGDEPGNCYLPAGQYELSYSLTGTDCEGDIIAQQWTEEREVTAKLRCGDHEETKEKYIGGGCFEDCTVKETIEATTLSGTVTCNMACGEKNCKYSATFEPTQ